MTFIPALGVSQGSFQYVVSDGTTTASANVTVKLLPQYPLHNMKNGNDVNNDGYVVAYDALLIINWLNAYGPTEIHRIGAASLPDLFYDTRADNFIAPSDALMVINYINSHPGPSSLAVSDAAEGEAVPSAASFDSADNTEFLSFDQQSAANNAPSEPPQFILLVGQKL